MKRKRVVVTGGAGFVGSRLCGRLVEDGYEVICLDNLASGNLENIGGLDLKFIRHDVKQPLTLEVDYIFHLASRASPIDFKQHAMDILLTNSQGTYNMLQVAKENNACFLLASSSEVYGNPQRHPQDESYWGNVNPVGVRSCYDEAKRFAEALSLSFCRNQGLDVRIARIFNTYGERMRKDDGRVIPNFINQAINGESMTIYGDGTQTRSFCYVSDMVEGLVRFMFTDDLEGEVLNLGNPNEGPILEVAKLIKNLTHSGSEIVFSPLPQDDPVRRKPDIAKAKQLLGWEPRVSLKQGLNQTIEYFREFARTHNV